MRELLGNFIGHFVSIAAALDWMQWLLLAGIFMFGLLLVHCQRSPDEFDLRHLIVNPETGKVDRFSFAYVFGLLFVSWFFLYFTMAGKITESYFGLYVVYCAAPKAIEAWIAARRP